MDILIIQPSYWEKVLVSLLLSVPSSCPSPTPVRPLLLSVPSSCPFPTPVRSPLLSVPYICPFPTPVPSFRSPSSFPFSLFFSFFLFFFFFLFSLSSLPCLPGQLCRKTVTAQEEKHGQQQRQILKIPLMNFSFQAADSAFLLKAQRPERPEEKAEDAV